MHPILKRALFVIFIAYFAVDAVFMAVAKPIARSLDRLKIWGILRRWIRSLGPYPTLALFAVPLIILEPVKPVAAYLIGTGAYFSGLTVLVVGEILKLVLVERLFSISRDKLLSIPAFSWAYGYWRWTVDWLQSTAMWRDAKKVMRATRLAFYNAAHSMLFHPPRYIRVEHPKTRKRRRPSNAE